MSIYGDGTPEQSLHESVETIASVFSLTRFQLARMLIRLALDYLRYSNQDEVVR